MKLQKILLVMAAVILLVSSAVAGDFDWIKDLNIRAVADPSGFRAELAARFKIGDADISIVLGNVDKPADAYMVFRLGEMSRKSTDYVISRYQAAKGKGWGVLAKSLGIKPGSRAFHALKRGHDMGNNKAKSKGKGKSKK